MVKGFISKFGCNFCGIGRIYSAISFFKSIRDDDYLVSENNEEFKIRESTNWCTKDFENFLWYINGVQDSIYGFVLILNDSLPYNHPDGAILAGLKVDEKATKNNNQKPITESEKNFTGICEESKGNKF